MIELVHQLYLLEHVGAIGPMFVQLEHHHLTGGFVSDLKMEKMMCDQDHESLLSFA